MLFRSLIDRLLGTNESIDTAAIGSRSPGLPYEKHPGLLLLLIRLLVATKAAIKDPLEFVRIGFKPHNVASETIFPVLELLRRAPPPDRYGKEVRHLVLDATSSPDWHIRDIAARTFAACTRGRRELEEITSILGALPLTQNARHGRLLCIKYIVQDIVLTTRALFKRLPIVSGVHSKLLFVEGQMDLLTPLLMAQQKILLCENTCPFTMATYLDVWISCGDYLLTRLSHDGKWERDLS